MGATIEGKAKLWSKSFDGKPVYSITISSKDKDGNWINAYQRVRFKKDATPPPNGTLIDYKAFATVSKGREKNSVLWQITEFSVVGEIAAETGFTALTTDDIPF